MLDFTLQKRQLCDIQGRLFELALKAGYDCPYFIKIVILQKFLYGFTVNSKILKHTHLL